MNTETAGYKAHAFEARKLLIFFLIALVYPLLLGKTSISFNGEAFQIVLQDGTHYAASAMLTDGEPTVREFAPDAGSSSLSGRITGRKAEIRFHSADGRLRVVWRAVARDDANYLRQEVDLSAEREDLKIREIIWLNDAIPGARAGGKVDG